VSTGTQNPGCSISIPAGQCDLVVQSGLGFSEPGVRGHQSHGLGREPANRRDSDGQLCREVGIHCGFAVEPDEDAADTRSARSAQFGVAIDQFTNLAVIVDQANNRVLLFPMPN